MCTLVIGIEGILCQRFAHSNLGTRVSQTGHHTHKHGKFQTLREFKGIRHHIISLLLRRGFEDRYHGKLAIETRVLLVLRRVHRRVICRQHHQSTMHTRDGRVDKSIGSHIHTHMFHTNDSALARIRHTQSGLHGGLLIRTPTASHLRRVSLYIFGYLCRGRTRVGIDTTNTCMHGT